VDSNAIEIGNPLVNSRMGDDEYTYFETQQTKRIVVTGRREGRNE
jgi:hypothetical protein